MRKTNAPRSFCSTVKGELAKSADKDCCLMAELAAAVFACGSLILDEKGAHAVLLTENMAFAKRLLNTVCNVLKLDAEIAVRDNPVQKKRSYNVYVRDGELLLKLIGADGKNLFSGAPQDFLTRKSCCKKAALKGAFLGCGQASDPNRGYRAELVAKNEKFADYLLKLLKYFGILSKKVRRKGRYVVYLNEGDAVCALMSKIGAHGAILNFENVRALKETRNSVNRAVNCETANISKTVAAAVRQAESIRVIEEGIGLDALPQKLREACELRLKHRASSLKDLCELAGATKSAMNHRFRKIGEIADSLKGETKP